MNSRLRQLQAYRPILNAIVSSLVFLLKLLIGINILARSCLIIESFIALPNSPSSVYEAPRWTVYVPHIQFLAYLAYGSQHNRHLMWVHEQDGRAGVQGEDQVLGVRMACKSEASSRAVQEDLGSVKGRRGVLIVQFRTWQSIDTAADAGITL